MTDEQINIAIAESLGWTHCKVIAMNPEWWEDSHIPEFARIGCRPPHWGAGSCTFPNYTADLNACHEFECNFNNEESLLYDDALCDVCVKTNELTNSQMPWRFTVTTATARQRCEAYLRAIGKWKEGA